MATRPAEGHDMLDVAGAAGYLGVNAAFVRRLVLERRIRYFKLGKFVRFRPVDLDTFIEAGRHEPVALWTHTRSSMRRPARSVTRQANPVSPRRSPGGTPTGQ
jgi:excisionase family DNA binding protein